MSHTHGDRHGHHHGHGHSHSHSHGHPHGHGHAGAGTPLRALVAALAITSTVFFAELIGGIVSGSVALIADAMHMLSDAAGLIIAVIAVVAGTRAANTRATYGYRRAEVLAALINAATVIMISIFIVVEAVKRFKEASVVEHSLMLTIAIIGFVANALSAWILSRHSGDSINVRGALLHVMVDMLGSVAVIVASLVIRFTGFMAADVIASLLIAAMVLPRAVQLLTQSARVLLEQVPVGFDESAVGPALRAVPGIIDTHDIHLWSLDGTSVIATAHVVLADGADPAQVLDQSQRALGELGISHSTIQLERPEHAEHESIC